MCPTLKESYLSEKHQSRDCSFLLDAWWQNFIVWFSMCIGIDTATITRISLDLIVTLKWRHRAILTPKNFHNFESFVWTKTIKNMLHLRLYSQMIGFLRGGGWWFPSSSVMFPKFPQSSNKESLGFPLKNPRKPKRETHPQSLTDDDPQAIGAIARELNLNQEAVGIHRSRVASYSQACDLKHHSRSHFRKKGPAPCCLG